MRLFLDTSVLLSASGSAKGASRFIVDEAKRKSWQLASSRYCREETLRNLPKIGEEAVAFFEDTLSKRIQWVSDAWSSRNILLYSKAKDKPVLLGALATKSDYLLTLDRVDFEGRLGKQFYGMSIRTLGDWLIQMRDTGKLENLFSQAFRWKFMIQPIFRTPQPPPHQRFPSRLVTGRN